MGQAVTWTEAQAPSEGVVERGFRIVRSGSVVPGILWLPARHESSCPIVLLGHGASGNKRSERIVRLARWFATSAALATMAIDGPYHGDRVASPLAPADYQRQILTEGVEVVANRMVDDWRAAVELVGSVTGVDPAHLGYFGLSMGTRYGLAFAAAAGPELRCAVFGKFGLQAAAGFYGYVDTTSSLRGDAERVSASTLFHVQWDDELFPRQGQFDLFDSLSSTDKLLTAYPGKHAETHPAAFRSWCGFIAEHLRPGILPSDHPSSHRIERQPDRT